jgi:hypothetical protein
MITQTAATTATLSLTSITSKQFEMEVMEGLKHILTLTNPDDLWPRMVSTHATKGAQKRVENFAEAMAWFKAANYLDCRMSAYPIYTVDYINRTGIAPSVLLADIDREHFETVEEFESVTAKTYFNFHNILGSRPTQLWTGGGRHFLTPQHVGVFEKSNKFSKFDQPSRQFMQFEEQLLTDGNGDQDHWRSVSFNNCMLRIPGTLNYDCVQFDDKGRIMHIPYDARVRIEKYWDANIPIVGRVILMQYYNYLQFSKLKDLQEQRQRRCMYGRAKGCINLHSYDYIDRLFNKPIDNFRKLCIWKIFVPYFVNIKRLSHLEAFNRTRSWLDRCNSISRLNFDSKWKINYALKNVGTFFPPRQDSLADANKLFYERLRKEGVIC